MFDAVDHRYDLLNRLLSLGLDAYLRNKTARLALTGSNVRILDVCTGTGNLAIACAKADESRTVVGLDFSPTMVSIAHHKAARCKLSDRIRFVQGDALRMPFPDNSFDAVTIGFGARNLGDVEVGLREMARVVRPGGTIVVLELTAPESPFARFVLRHVVPVMGKLVSGVPDNPYKYLSESVSAFLQPSELARLLEQVGLVHVDVRVSTLGLVLISTARTPALPRILT